MSKDVGGAAGPEMLLDDLRELERLYNTDRVAHQAAKKIERIFDKWLHESGGTDAPPPAPPLRKVGVNEANADDRGVAALPSQSLVCSDAVSGEARRGSEDRERRELPARVGQARRHRANASDSQAALVEIWRADADEIEKDGYFCCAQTRRHDAEDLAATLTDAPSRGDRAESSARVPHAMTAKGREA